MEPRITDRALIALAGLIGVVAVLFLAITRYRWHVFIALVLPILLLGLLPGFDRKT
jgi:GntP family gluconate:H+ symporter